jgi:hypothetical protein
MSSPFTIQPAALFRSTAIDPVAFQSLAAAAGGAALPASASSIVELSGLGQVLAAGSSLASSLEALRAGTANATPESVLGGAQNFVAAFNRVEQSIVGVLPLLGSLPERALFAGFAQTLDAAANAAPGAGGANLGNLQAIGISFQAAAPGDLAAGVGRLSIDPGALAAAAQADPQGTAALLAQATQPLLLQVALFEARAASANGLPANLSVAGVGIPTSLLQNLPVDALLNNIGLADLDLATVGLDSNTLETTSAALATSLSATLGGPVGTAALTRAAEATPATLAAAAVAAAAPATPNLAIGGLQAPLAGAPTATTPDLAPPPATANSETLSADQDAAAARLALRNLLADTALRNVIFDPAYSALIASSHLIDFISPVPLTRASAIPADIPGAILPVNRARAISSYEEAANGFVRR